MAFSAEEQTAHESVMAPFLNRRRPPEEIRDEVDLNYRIEEQSVIIFEIRSTMTDRSEKIESPVSKATYVRTKDHWRVFWMQSDLKWHRYEPAPTADTLREVLDLVEADEYGCFWG